jgi:hypothetical protein
MLEEKKLKLKPIEIKPIEGVKGTKIVKEIKLSKDK